LQIDAATRVWAAGTKASPLGAQLAQATGAPIDQAGRIEVESDCSVPGFPEIFVVGDLMSLNGLPGVAEVAMQSAAHAGHTIGRRLKGNTVRRPFHYHDLGTLAVISRFRAVAKVGPLKVGGLIGWLLWLVVHVTFLTGFKNRFGALARWAVSFVGHGRYERALIGRWATGEDPSADSE
jgi:NADH dehydrogenase